MRRPSGTGPAPAANNTVSDAASEKTQRAGEWGQPVGRGRRAGVGGTWAGRDRQVGVLDGDVRHVVVGDDPVDPDDADGVEVLWRYHLTPDRLGNAIDELPDLRWVHSDYVGVEDLPLEKLADRGIILSNGAGIAARPMAEWVVLAILSAAKSLPRFVRQSDAGLWEVGQPLAELDGAVVLLLGLGAVGTLVAAMLEPFGVEVRACTRRPRADARAV